MIKHHKELAEQIAGKRILLLNSLGKDSALCLHWLATYARPSHIISLNYQFLALHPDDLRYRKHQERRYPNVEFQYKENLLEVTRIMQGIYQDPLDRLEFLEMEYDTFDTRKRTEEFRVQMECDYVCLGLSRHESFQRANFFHKNGILDADGKKIYPLGMMSKQQIHDLIRDCRIKVHPVYKLHKSTLDQPSWYRMRASFVAYPEYYREMLRYFPMLELDRYRWEVLLK